MTTYTSINEHHPYPRKFISGRWPTADMMPASALAESIVAYLGRYRHHPHLPPAPWEPRLGHVRLPELGPDGEIDPLPDQDAKPLYRTTRISQVNGTPYMPGVEVTSIAWPTDLTLEPVNAEAYRVRAYYLTGKSTGFLKTRPFDIERHVIDLPALCDLADTAGSVRENPPQSMRTVA